MLVINSKLKIEANKVVNKKKVNFLSIEIYIFFKDKFTRTTPNDFLNILLLFVIDSFFPKGLKSHQYLLC